MKLTLGEAAKEIGKSKGTLSKALKSGKLSAERNKDGSFAIDPAELFRVFPKQLETELNEQLETPSETHGNAFEIGRLQAELEVTRRETELLRETLADLRSDRDAWRQQAERQTILLHDRRDKEATSGRTGWLRKLLRSSK